MLLATGLVCSVNKKYVSIIIIIYLDVSVNEPVQFNIVIVFTKWSNKNLCNLQPSYVEDKLKKILQGLLLKVVLMFLKAH